MDSVGTPLLWAGFLGFVALMLAADLGIFHRRPHEQSLKEAGIWSAVWVSLAGCFALGLYFLFGTEQSLEFTTGYLIEKALAVDNIFVFVVVFAAFRIPAIHQHRVLYWGVFGALVMRAIFIFAGGALIQRFHWMMYIFGAVLAFTGLRLLLQRDHETNPAEGRLIRWLQRVLPLAPEATGPAFTVVKNGKRYGTPLLLALIAIEITDLIFAVDSIPAIFAVTTDPFIVFTSNIFAILGLRSMYFLLAGVLDRFVYLKVGLACVLMFVGTKMLVVDLIKLPIVASLGVIVGILAVSIAASLAVPKALPVKSPTP